MRDDFISAYLEYTSDTEAPTFYHRWCCISMLGALLGREYNFPFGHALLNPNLYCMLIGVSGTRKSTAIKIAKDILKQSGYDYFSAEKTSKEKFLLDLEGKEEDEDEDILEKNLFGKDDDEEYDDYDYNQMFIACDEFNDFIGHNNMEFISLLGSFWDYRGTYKNRIKHGKSVNIPNPTISILGGNTPTSFQTAFPPETIGQGFFSRLLLIYGEPTNIKITFPKTPSSDDTAIILKRISDIKMNVRGVATLTQTAKLLVDKIYKNHLAIQDPRFDSYCSRRLTHLLKLCLVISAARLSIEINEEDVIYANTLLTHTENLMPKALGEFGRGRNSEVTHKVLEVLNKADTPMKLKDIWPYVSSDLDKLQHLVDIVQNLTTAEKLITIPDKGFLAKKRVFDYKDSDVFNKNFLSQQELDLL